ncbi:MAG: siphovirus Gp157 family protein [Magnetococcus sp. YQC-3]
MTCMPPLFIISQEFQDLQWLFAEGEIPEEEFQDLIQKVAADFSRKATNLAAIFLNLEADARAIDEATQRMERRRESLTKNAKRLRDHLLLHMQMTGMQEVKTPQFHIKIRKNPPHVDILCQEIIPDEFKEIVTTTKIDKAAIKSAINAGQTVPGAVLEQGLRLDVR